MVLCCARNKQFLLLEKVVPMEIKYVRRKTGLPLASEIFHFTNEVGQRV